MKRFALMIFCLSAAWCLTGCESRFVNPIALDIGHSRASPGATSTQGKTEFEFNRELADFVNLTLVERGVRVISIGRLGEIDHLQQRSQIANDAKAKFFLSLHHDSVQPQFLKTWLINGRRQHYSNYAAGFSLFISRKNPSWPASLHCASAIGRALQQNGFKPSPHHSEPIAGERRLWADRDNGVYYYDELKVLRSTAMPAVLLEAGVIVNPVEEQKLLTSAYRNKIAEAIAVGLANCAMVNKQ